MLIAANYSHPLVNLVRQGRVRVDRLKCPAWPDLVAQAQEVGPVYVHFPLRVGADLDEALDTESANPADWAKVEGLLRDTGTPFVNLHLDPKLSDYPPLAPGSRDSMQVARVTDRASAQVQVIARRFGPERVIVENCIPDRGRVLPTAYLPECISQVVAEAGCGLLLDLSHARLSADHLGTELHEYLGQLPLEQSREVHVSGVRRFDDAWADRLRGAGVGEESIRALAGRTVDHLPMTDEDWAILEWYLAQEGRGHPWVAALEYGGVGGAVWEALADGDLVEENVSRLARTAKGWGEWG